jgi:hypothetical protein
MLYQPPARSNEVHPSILRCQRCVALNGWSGGAKSWFSSDPTTYWNNSLAYARIWHTIKSSLREYCLLNTIPESESIIIVSEPESEILFGRKTEYSAARIRGIEAIQGRAKRPKNRIGGRLYPDFLQRCKGNLSSKTRVVYEKRIDSRRVSSLSSLWQRNCCESTHIIAESAQTNQQRRS